MLSKFAEWEQSQPVAVSVSVRGVPSRGQTRLEARYGAADGFGAMLSHPDIGVVSKNVNGKLHLELAAHADLAKHHVEGRNDCFFANVLTADFGGHWKGVRAGIKFDWDLVIKNGKF